MSRQEKFTGIAILGAVGTVVAIVTAAITFLVRPVAAAEVAPVANRVTALEVEAKSTKALLEEIRASQKTEDRRIYAICLAHPGAKCEDR